jgi:hypothetical protein
MSLKYEKPIMIPFNAASFKAGIGKCSAGSGDAGNCQDGVVALGIKCGTGNSANMRCQTGDSALDSCGQGNGGA